MKYLLGVDGGNTKTDYVLLGDDGSLIDGLRSGTCSHEAFGNSYDKARDIIKSCVNELLERNRLAISNISSAAFGLAGADFSLQIKELRSRLESLGFKRFEVANDSFLGIKAACCKGYGVCSINGTGTVAGGVDKNGHFLQVGGIGLLFGDEGGGSFIAGQGIRLTYDYLFRCGEYTSLAGKLLKLFQLGDDAEGHALFAEKYVFRDRNKIKTLDIIKLIYEAATEGDKVCLNELSRIGTQLALSAGGCITKLDFSGCDEIDIVMAGSVWSKSEAEYIHDAFRQKLMSLTDKKLNIIKLTSPPVAGAALWALEIENGIFPDEPLRRCVTQALTESAHFS